MKEYDCPICHNTEWIDYTDEDGYSYVRPCKCQKIRKSILIAQNSGLGDLLSIYTFDKFSCQQGWQKDIKTMAVEYCKEDSNKWFTILGQSGVGKSHICTAICGELINQGVAVVYMSWLESSGNLKRQINEQEYEEKIRRYKNAEVLYIDDFFKSENNTAPTPADIKLANEILNYRYNKARADGGTCKTIISSERTIKQLIEYDEAIAGRIVEMSDGYLTEIKGKEKNYRLKEFL